MDYDFLSVSDGTGDAPLMHIQADRLVGSSVIDVDIVTGVPAKFIATSGTLDAGGKITPSTKRDFKGHVSGADLIIDAFLPGSTDTGHVAGQVVMIKPNTGWSDRVAKFIKNATGFGTPENLKAQNFDAAGDLTVTGASTFTGNIVAAGTIRSTPRATATTTTTSLTPNIDTNSIYDLTAQSSALTIANPAGTARNGDVIILRIRDNGTARAITWGTAYANVSGLDLITTTVANKWSIIGIQYNAAVTGTNKWQIVSLSTEV